MNKGIQQWCWKHCNKCDRWLIANTINFYKQKDKKYGLACVCKWCKGYKGKRNKNLSEEELRVKRNETCKRYYQKNKDRFKNYYKENREKILEDRKQHYIDHPEYYFNKEQKRRRKLEESKGNGFIEEQWYEMMQFFNWKCAYSGEDLYKRRSIDHIIPISKNGQDNIWNFVPMVSNYNSCKHNSDPLEWYKQQEYFSEERLNRIIEWQKYAYNKWATNNDPELILINNK